ncbi:alpha-ketoglutarate-dependent dioxygenase AlkB [Frankia sp. AgKG'84/4]|uniref:alpha-ketoglutarate-dependent dioxygenase AlkB n=1 Tax=Frankia sp. AgKG'84/4 TaxID=573490 RepID=UPI0020103F9F|nr:alpha-ketoglutarate-dependent dioxygenase AlkB [Frankia sp. AgKG'84/4]MCL9798256.1 alpha-ketoglutarate-dependent dioxygenase AlkB [Frankia sp. AgKG'84/4]
MRDAARTPPGSVPAAADTPSVRPAGTDAGANAAAPVDGVDPAARAERIWLDEQSWVDVTRGWLRGADELYAAMRDGLPWRQGTMWRYERHITEPRLSAWIPRGGPIPFPPLLDAYRTLRRTYGVDFDGFGMSMYRGGNDAVAFHRDREMRWLDDTVIAILSLGVRRPFLVKSRHLPAGRRLLNDPDAPGGRDLCPAGGDLIVLGGRAQADWLHAVPRVHGHVGGRISVQWRWTSRSGRPEQGPGYGAARHFSR